MKRRRSTKYCRKERQYQKQSDRFTVITGAMGFAGLSECIRIMEETVESLERVAQDPSSDLDSLSGDLEQIAGLSRMLEEQLACINNSAVRYINACKELAGISQPHRTGIPERGDSHSQVDALMRDSSVDSVHSPGDEYLEDAA